MSAAVLARPTSIDGVYVVEPAPIRDERGFFTRTLDLQWLSDAGLVDHFVHHNQSRSERGVLRGLHVRAGRGETKMVRCARGSIVDHVVDARPWSSTFGRSERFELNDDTFLHLYLPPFVAHGFQVTSDWADVCYLHSRTYGQPDLSIAFDDPALGLAWPLSDPIVSERDRDADALAALDLERLFEREEPT